MRASVLCGFAIVLSLAGCGGDHPATPIATTPMRTLQGAIVKGPLADATVAFFHVDPTGHATGAAVATATSDAQGHVTVGLPASSEPLLAVSLGGSYVDESDDAGGVNRRRITLTDQQGFEAIVPANATTFVLTPYSMALLLRARRLANGANFLPVYNAVLQQAVGVFGFDPTAVIPDDPLAPNLGGNLDAVKYALLLGGAAYSIDSMAVELGVQPTYEIVIAFIEDLSDGRLDGQVNDTSLLVKAALPNDIDLNQEIVRFRNNHYDLYNGLLFSLNEGDWSGQPQLPPNLPPFAQGDAIVVAEGGTATSLVGGANSVLANDHDTGGAALAATLVMAPAHGTLTLNPTGTFIYKHDGSETTSDLFTYRANNGAIDSPVAVVTITITPVNDPPVALDDSYAGTEGQALSILAPGVLGNDSDPENSPLTAAVLDPPLHGTVNLNADGSFLYTPTPKFHGSDQFTYRASDGDAFSQPATVTIRVGSVNEAPIAVDDDLTGYENATLSLVAPGILGNDSDPDGDNLTAILVTPPAGGSLNLNHNGSLNYTPPSGFTGPVTFQYRVTDGVAQSNVATVRIAIRQNSPPVANDDCYSGFGFFCVDLDPEQDIHGPGVLLNDTDADGDTLRAMLVSQPQGQVTLDPQGGFCYSPPVSNNTDTSFFGSDSFTYRATDGHSLSNIATVFINPFFGKATSKGCSCSNCGF